MGKSSRQKGKDVEIIGTSYDVNYSNGFKALEVRSYE